MKFRAAALLALLAALAVSAASLHSGRALSGTFLIGTDPDTPEDKTKPATPSSRATDSGQCVGAAVCQGRHNELYKGFAASPHWMTTQETKMTHGDKSKIFTLIWANSEEITERCIAGHECKVGQREFMRSKKSSPTRGVA